jgi:flagellar biosynthesis component FlhA
VLVLIDLHIGGEPVKLLAEATLTLVLFADASRISFPALRSEFAVPAPLTIVAGTLLGIGVLPGVSFLEALVLSIMLACTDARARPGGRDRRADPVADPARSQRRERPQRRSLRAALLHRARARARRDG